MDGYENYDLQEEDPYLIEGSTCLKNSLGITNTAELNEAEAAISAAAMAELSGYAFEWSAVSGEQMAIACIAARQRLPDFSRLERLLLCILWICLDWPAAGGHRGRNAAPLLAEPLTPYFERPIDRAIITARLLPR